MGAWVKGVHTGLMHMLGVAILLFVAASVLGQSTPAPDNIIEGIQQLKFDTKSLISPSNRRHKLLTQLNKAVADLKSGKKNLTKNKIKQARKKFAESLRTELLKPLLVQACMVSPVMEARRLWPVSNPWVV